MRRIVHDLDRKSVSDNIRVSVIIPIYNVEEFLKECLDSVLDYSGRVDAEVLLVDDGSTDGSCRIAETFCEENENFQLYRIENSGVSAARNYGLERARGEFIQFVDADDIIVPAVYKEMLTIADSTGADVVRCNFDRLKNGAVTTSELALRSESGIVSPTVNIQDDPCLAYDTVCWNKLIKRSLFTDNGIRFPEKVIYNEDQPVMARIYACSRKSVACFKTGYLWCIRTGGSKSVTQRRREHQIMYDKFDMMADTVEFFRNEGKKKAAREVIWYAAAMIMPTFLEFIGDLQPEDAAERLEYLEGFLDRYCDDDMRDSLPAIMTGIISDIRKRDADHIEKLINYRKTAYRNAPLIYSDDGDITVRLPDDMAGFREYPAYNEMRMKLPVIAVSKCVFRDDRIMLEGYIVQKRVQTNAEYPQRAEVFLTDSMNEKTYELRTEIIDSPGLTDEYGSVICFEDYRSYSYDHGHGGFRIEIDPGSIDRQMKDFSGDMAVIVRFSNALNKGTRTLRGATADVRRQLKRWKYTGEHSEISVRFDRSGNLFIRRREKIPAGDDISEKEEDQQIQVQQRKSIWNWKRKKETK